MLVTDVEVILRKELNMSFEEFYIAPVGRIIALLSSLNYKFKKMTDGIESPKKDSDSDIKKLIAEQRKRIDKSNAEDSYMTGKM